MLHVASPFLRRRALACFFPSSLPPPSSWQGDRAILSSIGFTLPKSFVGDLRRRLLRRTYHGTFPRAKDVTMTWHVEGEAITVTAPEGKTLLEVAHDNDIELEGACGGELACSTCHVVFTPELYARLPAKKEEEEDMLDLAWGLTETSRLGCQIKVTPLLENAVITIPEETNNMLGGEDEGKGGAAGGQGEPWAK